ncbi:hypothetical protein [Sphingobium sp. EM0848]|uniref:hypothetical protein n=1 Tax=Sphingobium sp. EM0848 TaxID=2743473 RepID=UPI00159C0455|nr:hypothetical protein [Sphingobium sp. EM0848]
MSRSLINLISVAHRHALTEGAQDVDAIMATMEGEPVYELYPVGKRFSGMANTRRYYEHFVAHVQQRMRGAAPVSQSFGPDGVVEEYTISILLDGATEPSMHRIMAILTFGEEGLSGERIYSDEAFLRTLLGPLWAELEPIELHI